MYNSIDILKYESQNLIGYGKGFFIRYNADIFFVTCNHVIQNTTNIRVMYNNRNVIDLPIDNRCKRFIELDLAIFKISDISADLSEINIIELEERDYNVIKYEKGYFGHFEIENLELSNKDFMDINFLHFPAITGNLDFDSEGYSGSIIFSEDNDCIGMLCGQAGESAFLLLFAFIKKMIINYDIGTNLCHFTYYTEKSIILSEGLNPNLFHEKRNYSKLHADDVLELIDGNVINDEGLINDKMLFGKKMNLDEYTLLNKSVNDINEFIVRRDNRIAKVITGNREIYSSFDIKFNDYEISCNLNEYESVLKVNLPGIIYLKKELCNLQEYYEKEHNIDKCKYLSLIGILIKKLQPNLSDNPAIEKKLTLRNMTLSKDQFMQNVFNPIIETF